MKLDLHVTIDAPAPLVWTALADEFVDIASWLPSVVRAVPLPDVAPLPGAPVAGRICAFTDRADGLEAHERITRWDPEAGRLDMEVEVHNAPAAIPVARNLARFTVERVGAGTRVRLEAEPTLKLHGYLVYPLIRANLSEQFQGLLDGLKAHVEARVSAAA